MTIKRKEFETAIRKKMTDRRGTFMTDRRKAFETLYDLIWNCSEKDYILREDEGIEWINETSRDHVGIAIIKSDIVVNENGDEKYEAVHVERYFEPDGLAKWVCDRVMGIVRPVGEKLLYVNDLDYRAINPLVRAGYIYVSDLNGASKKELLKIRNFGKSSLEKLETFCNLKGIKLED